MKTLLLQFVLGFFTNLHCQYLDVGSSIEASKDRSLPATENIFLVYKQSTLSRFVNHRTVGEFGERNPHIACSFNDEIDQKSTGAGSNSNSNNNRANCRCIHNAETFAVGFDAEALDVSDSPWFQYVVEEPGYYCASTTPFENVNLKFNVEGFTLGSFVSSYSFKASLLTLIPIVLAIVLRVETNMIRWFTVMFIYSNFKNFSLHFTQYFRSNSLLNLFVILIETYSPILLFRVIFNALRRKAFLKFHQSDNFNIKRQVFLLLFAAFQLVVNFNKHFFPLNYYILGMGSADRYLAQYTVMVVSLLLSLVYFTLFTMVSKRLKALPSDYRTNSYRIIFLILLWSPVAYYSVTLILAYISWHRDIIIIDSFKDDGLTKFSIMFKELFNSVLMTLIVVVHWLSGYY